MFLANKLSLESFSRLLAFFLLALWFLNEAPLLAQEPPSPPSPAEAPGEDKHQSLERVFDAITQNKSEIKLRQKELKSGTAQGREDEIKAEIRELSARQALLRRSLEQMATGIDPNSFSDQGIEENISWGEELHELLSPLLTEIKRLTTRPREIDDLQRRMESSSEQVKRAQIALKNTEDLLSQTTSKKLNRALTEIRSTWLERKEGVETQLSITRRQLDKLLSEQQSLVDSAKNIFNVFFRVRLLNLVFALLVTALFYFVLRRMHHRIQKLPRFLKRRNSLQIRLFNVIFLFFTSIGSLALFMLVLFLLHDWVLLTLSVMIILGLTWSSKQLLPRFWAQAAVLLNLGPVREGERVIVHGLPWRVSALNFYSTLVNDALDGGVIRLPIQDIPELRSRECGKDEPWYPTKKGDWVIVSDGVVGRIVHQGPELTVLRMLGGIRKTIPSSAFVELSPSVISDGFRHKIIFGIDYQHQGLATQEIPQQIEDDLRQGLEENGFAPQLRHLAVELAAAGASSLDLAIIADFSGDAAERYEFLKRFISRLCVESCNKHGWVIPFAQLTVHLPETNLPKSSSVAR